ncbi:MAG: Trans-aconitate 2-methyltransferase [Ilumatobacteraceae bacterium]|nr:Trans-aconitate 2-methyltransferase [Ilumatobacteraceae bacterium]
MVLAATFVDKYHTSVPTDWDPEQYRRFATERAQPFHDLLDLIVPATLRRAVDLGCGTGELTALAVARLDIGECVGIDSSAAMLVEAGPRGGARLRFELGDIGQWTADGDRDLVLANASLQWVADHPRVLARWAAALAPGGQLAVQVPANAGSPAHALANRLAHSDAYCGEFGSDGPPVDPVARNVLEPEHYAQLLFDLGFTAQHVRLQVYPHVLPSTRDIVEWVKGTTLTRFQKRLAPDVYARFLDDYERELIGVLGDRAPQFFPFRRILMWGRTA